MNTFPINEETSKAMRHVTCIIDVSDLPSEKKRMLRFGEEGPLHATHLFFGYASLEGTYNGIGAGHEASVDYAHKIADLYNVDIIHWSSLFHIEEDTDNEVN